MNEYPEKMYVVKYQNATWRWAETGLHYIKGNSAPYFYTTNGHGAAHSEIEAHFPGLKPFVALHLSDDNGLPLHALPNAWYHYAEGIDAEGNRVFHASKEAREAEQARREQVALKEFIKVNTGNTLHKSELIDIWDSVDGYAWSKKTYKSEVFTLAQSMKQSIKSTITELVVARNNSHLASHLRISLAEAQAIPANLTKEQFNALYIVPNIERWNREAQEAIAVMRAVGGRHTTPEKDGKTYWLSDEQFTRYFSKHETNSSTEIIRRK